MMRDDLPDFKAIEAKQQAQLGNEGVARILEAGRAWDLAPTLKAGGSVIIPHATLEICGHHIAAAVHACLDAEVEFVLAIGVLHALTDELEEARVRVAKGEDVQQEASWGIQGPGLAGRDDWTNEFSLSHFQFLWKEEIKRRGIEGPELIIRYPYLAGGKPEILPGIDELVEIAKNAAVVATGDLFHHGIGYGDPPEEAQAPEHGGIELCRRTLEEGFAILQDGDYWGYNQHCVRAKSDARDAGQVLRFLLGPLEGRILDIIADDMTGPYNAPAPTWVACSLVELVPVAT
jgi:hypothetical protein